MAAAAAALAAVAPVAGAQEPAATVQARGNPLYASSDLRFAPDLVAVRVGQVVRWTNADALVPHTATELHGLWDLGGGYGATPANPPGVAPGASVQRAFEAGRHSYYCRVHPQPMRGTVDVPVELEAKRRRIVRVRTVRARVPGRRAPLRVRVRVSRMVADVTMTWAPAPAAGPIVFDVEVRRDGRRWDRYATGTPLPAGRLVGLRAGQVVEVRARMRRVDDESAATEWSPVVSVGT